ncbi:MAG: tetratricopeptide repeat protein [Chloroflexota bacterium]|nr:tetratricopeptide repeat protein [Chloroflexota bacterium]
MVPVQVGTHDPDAAARAVIDRYFQVWTPTLILLSPEGGVFHEWSGYLPPSLYLAQLGIGLGKAAIKRNRFDEATGHFNDVVDRYPTSDADPEALYWAAVARYKGSGKSDDLMTGWQKLRSRFPESVWRIKHIFSEG